MDKKYISRCFFFFFSISILITMISRSRCCWGTAASEITGIAHRSGGRVGDGFALFPPVFPRSSALSGYTQFLRWSGWRRKHRSSPEGPALTSPGPWHQDCLRSLLLEMTVLRPTSSLRKTRNQSLLRQDLIRHAWQGLPSRRVAY